MIKQIVLQVGRKIIDFFAWFDLVIISILLIFGVFVISVVDYEFYIKVFMTIGALVIAIILFMVSILCKYFTYLFIDIRDNTAKMTNNDENTEELNKSISKVYMYLNSYDFSDKYALGYFKIYGNVVNNDYVKKGVVCNCDPKEKSITSIWFGNYEKGVLTEEENYISLKRLQEEKVYPNTHGDIMWQSMCQLHNTLSEKQKVDYKKNFKD